MSKILYVEKDFDEYLDGFKMHKDLLIRGIKVRNDINDSSKMGFFELGTSLLKKGYEVETASPLDYATIDRVLRRDYDALISHLPFSLDFREIENMVSTKKVPDNITQLAYSKPINHLRAIRNLKPNLPIIAYSGANIEEIRRTFGRLPIDAFVEKTQDKVLDSKRVLLTLERLLIKDYK